MARVLLEDVVAINRSQAFIDVEGFQHVMEPPTIEQLIRHAERYGISQVLEAAAEVGHQEEALIRLCARLDVVDREHYAKEHSGRTAGWPKPKKSAEDRVKALLAAGAAPKELEPQVEAEVAEDD